MAYTVLARKYRSRTFEEVIGQEPIATTLVNAIKAERIHHGYLFTGTRGVGKTSMARILAKALNCLKADAPTVTPCCECDACRSIAEGQDVDVLEIDAASNTGVDNIRELRSNTAYRPARSRFKVYIIDEVHMLSTGAFNALLKTLEEPPDHVKFILATTEIQKVPATIQSRCQRFNFRNIDAEAIGRRLAEIVKEEGAEAEDAVIKRVARLAAGSMRDALSILDQLLSVSPTRLDAQVLDEILPPAQDERIFELLSHAAEGDAARVLTDLDGILGSGRGLEVFCSDAVELVRALMLVRTCGPDAAMVDIPAGSRDEYVKLSQRFELSHYVQMIAMLEELRRNTRYSGAGRALAEALMVRFARMQEWTSIEQLLRQLPADAAGGDEKKKSPTHVAAEPAAVAPSQSSPTLAQPSPLPRGEHRGVEHRPASDPPPNPSLEGRGVGSAASGPHPDPSVAAGLRAGCEPVAAGLHAGREMPADGPPPEYVPESDADIEVPDEYIPGAGEVERPPSSGEVVRKEISLEDRRRVEQDPVVRQTLDLFNGILMNVEQRMPAREKQTAE